MEVLTARVVAVERVVDLAASLAVEMGKESLVRGVLKVEEGFLELGLAMD